LYIKLDNLCMMLILSLLPALLGVVISGPIGTAIPTQSATSPSLSRPSKTTPVPHPPGSLVPTSAQGIRQSSVASPAATQLPPIPSPFPPHSPDCLTSHTASKITGVRLLGLRKRLLRTGILRDQEDWLHCSYLLCLDPDLRNHQFMGA
jgi:hypothetical protein